MRAIAGARPGPAANAIPNRWRSLAIAGGAVDAREEADFASNLANLVEGAAIGPAAGIQDVVPEDIFAKALKSALRESALLVHFFLGLFGNRGEDFFLQGIH